MICSVVGILQELHLLQHLALHFLYLCELLLQAQVLLHGFLNLWQYTSHLITVLKPIHLREKKKIVKSREFVKQTLSAFCFQSSFFFF